MHRVSIIKNKWFFAFEEVICVRSENCKKMQRFLIIKQVVCAALGAVRVVTGTGRSNFTHTVITVDVLYSVPLLFRVYQRLSTQ